MVRSLLQAAVCGDLGPSLRPLLACSACAGDYEDPDRTAWTPDPEEVEDQDEALSRERAGDDAGDEAARRERERRRFPAKKE